MPEIFQATSDQDRQQVRELFWEYLKWANSRVNEEFEVDFDIESMLKEDMAGLEMFSPPNGRVLLVEDAGEVVGLGCLRRINPGVAEIKRRYIRPTARGKGLGRALLDRLVQEARAAGYSRLSLDSARFMNAAHTLYRFTGFREIDPYPESEIPQEFQRHWVFMELDLGPAQK